MKMVRLAEPETFDVPLAAPRSHCETRLTRSKFGNCMKQILVFLLSYIGLITSVVAYAILGGVIFMALEGPNEELVKTKATTVRLKYIQDMYDAFDKMNVFHKENWTIRADKVLRRFQKEMYDLMTKEGLDGGELKETNPKWTFASSLLFAVTVITTIGYGTYTPKTIAGQVTTMLYAVIGIPLTLLCLTNIGKPMAICFREAYGRAFCMSCRKKYRQIISRKRSCSSLDQIELENHGLTGDDLMMKHCEGKHEETEVPITTCLFLIVWYIVFGSIMFTIWEKDWSVFTGAYFCFITLSTIGFGDIVPGLSHEDWNDQLKQVACALYLLIGLSTIAMCFELMQSKGQETAKRFARFIGLLNE